MCGTKFPTDIHIESQFNLVLTVLPIYSALLVAGVAVVVVVANYVLCTTAI